MNLKVEESFIESIIFEQNAKCVSYPFIIPSSWARGGSVDLLLTIVLDKNYKSTNFQIILKECARKIKKQEGIDKAFFESHPKFKEVSQIKLSQKALTDILQQTRKDIKKNVENPDMGVFLMMGLSLVGKTTMIERVRNGAYNPNIKPTLTYNIIELLVEDHIFKTIDVSGQKRLRSDWWTYSRIPDAVIYVFDITDPPERYEEGKLELKKVLQHYQEGYEYQLSENCPLLICFNKIDLKENLDMTFDDIKNLIEKTNSKINYKFQLTSAVTGEGLEEGFSWIIKELLKFK